MTRRVWTYRPWTSVEVQRLREMREKLNLPHKTIAKRLGRSIGSVWRACRLYGKTQRRCDRLDSHEAIIRKMHAAGHSASAIGRVIGCCPTTARRWLRQLDLQPCHNSGAAGRVVQREKLRHLPEGWHLCDLRDEARRKQAAAAGWPMLDNLAQVAVMEALAARPQTAHSLGTALGRSFNTTKGHVLTLRRFGYVVDHGREPGHGGAPRTVYAVAAYLLVQRRGE